MHYSALATDYDGTLAKDGQVSAATLVALQRLQASGARLILITGRQLEDLSQVFAQVDLFDCVVAENGALLYWPATGQEQLLGDRPSEQFIATLQQRQVEPLSIGKVIVATWKPQETTVLEVIQELGLELQVILNKGAVMILPTGINKATGLRAALNHLNLDAARVVGVGDAENDQAFLELCGYSVAVANALPSLKAQVDWVTQASHGNGVIELIDQLLIV